MYESIRDKKTPWVPLVYWNWIITLLWQWTWIAWYPFLSQWALGLCLQGNVFITVNKNVEQGRENDILIQPHVLFHQVFTFFPHLPFYGKLIGVVITVRKRSEPLICLQRGPQRPRRGIWTETPFAPPLLILGTKTWLAPSTKRRHHKWNCPLTCQESERYIFSWLVARGKADCPIHLRPFYFYSSQNLKWCNHFRCSTEEDMEHKPQKLVARKEMKEGWNIQENDVSFPTHTALAAPVSQKVMVLHSGYSHGAEWQMH